MKGRPTDRYMHMWSTEEGIHLKRIKNDGDDDRIAWKHKGTAESMFITWNFYWGNRIAIWGSQPLHINTEAVSMYTYLLFCSL